MLEHYDHISELAGWKVKDWSPDDGPLDPTHFIYRIAVEYDDQQSWSDKLGSFLQDPAAKEITGLVVGLWTTDVLEESDSIAVVETLAAASPRLPALKILFIGDILSEESEISWIEQTDLSQIFQAYPQLAYFGARGGSSLRLGNIQLQYLRTLVIEAGGLSREVVHDIQSSDLPALEHLEIWLGTPDYGGDTTIEDLAPLLRKPLFPKLRYLGLRNSAITNGIASVFAYAPILERIEVFDLSLGTLTDEGAQVLLQSPLIAKLKKLDVHHHFCSDEMTAQLKQLSIEVDASGQEAREQSWGNNIYVSFGE